MTFRRVDPNSHYRALRFLSEEGRWEIGLSPYHNGIRLRMGSAGRPPSVIDFCLGQNTDIYSPVLLSVMRILEAVEETASPAELDAAFPWKGTRPDLNIHLEALLGGGYPPQRAPGLRAGVQPRS